MQAEPQRTCLWTRTKPSLFQDLRCACCCRTTQSRRIERCYHSFLGESRACLLVLHSVELALCLEVSGSQNDLVGLSQWHKRDSSKREQGQVSQNLTRHLDEGLGAVKDCFQMHIARPVLTGLRRGEGNLHPWPPSGDNVVINVAIYGNAFLLAPVFLLISNIINL